MFEAVIHRQVLDQLRSTGPILPAFRLARSLQSQPARCAMIKDTLPERIDLSPGLRHLRASRQTLLLGYTNSAIRRHACHRLHPDPGRFDAVHLLALVLLHLACNLRSRPSRPRHRVQLPRIPYPPRSLTQDASVADARSRRGSIHSLAAFGAQTAASWLIVDKAYERAPWPKLREGGHSCS
ncbi:hypothetical protein PENSPDRAFT_749194 [Peniophora sp. CONT]|nr:hypothetical protein PENSPDRAFT_749194 [Peniophora sp. CONT]